MPADDPDSRSDAGADERWDAQLEGLTAERLATLSSDTILVLPVRLEGPIGQYRADDVYAIKELRRSGLQAEFLHPASERAFLHEHSSQIVWTFAIGTAESLSAAGLIALWNYIRSKVGNQEQEPVLSEQPIRIEVRGYRGKGVRLRRAVVEGPANDATRQILEQVLRGEADD